MFLKLVLLQSGAPRNASRRLGLIGIMISQSANFRNGVHSVLVDQKIEEVNGVFIESRFGSNPLDEVLLLILVDGGVREEGLDILTLLHVRRKSIHVGMNGLKSVFGLSKIDEGIGIRSSNDVKSDL